MFFSVIIPTYNPKKYLPDLLSSINRNDCLDDIEIIISDDCSDEPFDDIFDSFDKLDIKKIENDHHSGFPRNGRQHGLEVASGDWICFADQDDCFIDNGFDKIKKYIVDNSITNFLVTDFVKHFDETGDYIIEDGTKGWTHGKFYEKKFLDAYDIHYDDVRYCEDINLITHIGCVLVEENIPVNTCHEPVYIWNQRRDSLSQGSYFAESMPDYIEGTAGVLVKHIEKFKYNRDIMNGLSIKFMQTLYHIYFYSQSNMLYGDMKCMFQIASTLLPILDKFLGAVELTPNDIVNKTCGDLIELYAKTRNDDYYQVPFIEHITFRDWINNYFYKL